MDKKVDPTVKSIVERFPEDFLRNTAKETGLIKRERKIDPVMLFWMLVLGFGVNFLRSIRGLKRKYEVEANTSLSISSFHDRFTPEIVEFLHRCVIHAIEFQGQQSCRALGEKLKGFKDLIIQDSMIIRLHESLSGLWQAACKSRKSKSLYSPTMSKDLHRKRTQTTKRSARIHGHTSGYISWL